MWAAMGGGPCTEARWGAAQQHRGHSLGTFSVVISSPPKEKLLPWSRNKWGSRGHTPYD